MTTTPSPFLTTLRPACIGLILSLLTILFGQGMGVVFGLNEEAIKGRLKTSASAVRDTHYGGSDSAAKPVLDKSWVYMQRAHLHAGAMGTTALALIILTCLLGASRSVIAVTSIALGAGGLGYSLFWMLAGFRAPGMGGTSAAKETLTWLAGPSSGAYVLASIAVLILLVATFARRRSSN